MQNLHIILLVQGQKIKGDIDKNNAKCANYTTCSVMENILFNMIYNAYMYYLFNDLHTMLLTLFIANDEY